MNIVGNHNNISIKISFAEIKNKSNELLERELTDNQIKDIMDMITKKAQDVNGITQELIDNIICEYE